MIDSEAALRANFGNVHPLAITKARPTFDQYSRQFIALSPFVVVSTADASGRADLSPRGDPPGFAKIVDDKTLLIPDRPGNNRLDTMGNIVSNPNVACLFFIPGFDDTLRVAGRARVTDDATLLAGCAVNGKAPKVGILITVDEVFMHCAKALRRSKLWGEDYRRSRDEMPSIARIILAQTSPGGVDEAQAQACDTDVEGDYKTGLY